MKITFVTYRFSPPDFGGELLHAVDRFRALVRRGHAVTVLTTGRAGFPAYERDAGLEVHRSPRHREGPLRRVRFVGWAALRLARTDSDAVHFGNVPGIGRHGQWIALFVLAKIAKLRGARTVVVHSLADSEANAFAIAGVEGALRRLALSQIDHIVSVGPALHEAIAAFFPERAVLIPYGVRLDVVAEAPPARRRALRAALETGEDDVVFTFLGVVNLRKGADLLAEAFRDLVQAHPRWKLWIIGPLHRDGSDRPDPAEAPRVHEPLRENPGVRFLGRIDDRRRLFEHLAASDVFVFPTRREGFPIAPMEAMALGLPVVSSRIPGVTDVVGLEGVTGFFVEAGDAASLRDAMERVGADPGLRARMGVAASRRIQEAFSWERCLSRWESIYASGQPGIGPGAEHSVAVEG